MKRAAVHPSNGVDDQRAARDGARIPKKVTSRSQNNVGTNKQQRQAIEPSDQSQVASIFRPIDTSLSAASSPPSSTACTSSSCSSIPFLRPSYEARWEDYDATNKLIVKELNELSFYDREFLYDDIHGVADQLEETEEFLEERFQSMQTAINWIKVKPAYERARFMLPSSVENHKLRLACLRTANYDAVRAAQRLVKYFDMKLEIFGLDKLVTPQITQADLTDDMLECLRIGYLQVLPPKDQVGRSIFFVAAKYTPQRDWKTMIGVNWYLMAKSIENSETQKKGIVSVIYSVGNQRSSVNVPGLMTKTVEFSESFPYRTSACHYCYNDSRLRPFISILQVALGKNNRLRMRTHFGSHLESMYKLLSYGIVPSSLPVDSDGDINLPKWHEYLESLREAEKNNSPRVSPNIIVPTSKDCLLGRGRPFQSYPGNVFLADVIQRNKPIHSKLRRGEKTKMTIGILNYIKNVRGGRFLKRRSTNPDDTDVDSGNASDAIDKDDVWVLASDEEGRQKIGHMCRAPDRNDLPAVGESTEYTYEGSLSILVPPSTFGPNCL